MKTIKRNLGLLMLALAGFALAGCAVVPKTKITGAIAGQPFSLSSPKDSELKDLEVSVVQTGTNTTTAKIKIGSLSAKMNPDVISSQGAANAAVMNAAASLVEKAGASLGAAAGTALKEAK